MMRDLAHLDRLPPGDRAVRIRAIALEHHQKLAVLERVEPDRRTPGMKAGITRHRRALATLDHLARRAGVALPDWRPSMNDNPRPRPNVTPNQAAHAAAAALEHTADRLMSLGVAPIDVARTLVGVGLSRLSRELSPQELVDEMAHVIGGYAEAHGIDLTAEQPATPTH
ncbi:hypothetical protein [Methylobacterium isbiliense]|jgi:hypothetical protein|uniref:Uncharacterized protein n=1 Tax=Methylobacterium isbiliense TaxID=315478 RepID=A0ABQ4SQD3_9HYPH|nr:hypothetical protein [Methylobacterium isbiliense]MDN3627237.1 hypothetical protein [Methylobacterium isbiliense]GJE04023.1 hypothetical protein GMJLKIPL_5983 [Methylobacterium isbiliense]